MNQRLPAPPFVVHSLPTHRPQTPDQPPIVMDVQRLVEHMRADFRTEFQTLKAELLADLRAELQKMPAPAPAPAPSQTALGPVDIASMQRAIIEALRAPTSAPLSKSQDDEPLFLPSDLLTPREGTVDVKTAGEGLGSLDDAAEALKRMKRGKK